MATASICLATAEGFKFQLHSSFGSPVEAAADLIKRATISTTFKFAAPQFSYYVDILVGSAHDFIRLRLSSDPFTWFPGPLPRRNYCNVQTDDNFSLCLQYNFSGSYDPSGSSTFKNLSRPLDLTSSDPRYYVSGYYGQDTLQIGQTEVDNVPIGIAYDYTRTPQLGLGIGGSGSTEKTLIRTMLDEDVISVLAYGLYLNDFDTNSSELTIGAIDTAKYVGNLITFESSATTTVQLNSLEYDDGSGNPETLATSWNANVEFSTGLLYFPNGPLQAIVGDVEAYLDSTYGGYLTKCSYRYTAKTLIFNFQGTTITVPAKQWIVPAYTVSGYQTTLRGGREPACIVLVDSMDNYSLASRQGYTAVFGMPFVRATYMVHDFTNNQTSFAQAKLNTTDSELKSLGTDGVAPFATVVPSTTMDPSNITPTTTETGSVTAGPGGNNNNQSDGQTSGGGSSTPTGAIVGGVVGGVAVIAAAIGAFIFLRRRQNREANATDNLPLPPPMDQTQQQGQPPFSPPYGGYPNQNAGYNQQGYDGQYGQQGGYNETYGLAPALPNKGLASPTSPGPYPPPQSPMSEMAATPMDPSRHSSVVSPLDQTRHPSVVGVTELASPGGQQMPVELPGNMH